MGGCPTGTVPGSFQRGGRKRGLQTDLQNEIVREIETLLGCQSIADLDFEAVELAARRQSLRLAARALEQRLNTDTSDHVGPQLPCPCGGSAQYHGRHGKTLKAYWGRCTYSALTITVRNARTDSARETGLWAGIVFADARRSAHDRQRSSAAELRREQRVIARIGAEVSAKRVERAAEALRAEIAVDEHQQVEMMGEVAPTMYLGMDGTGVPMRTQRSR
jgi:hypothetical protein